MSKAEERITAAGVLTYYVRVGLGIKDETVETCLKQITDSPIGEIGLNAIASLLRNILTIKNDRLRESLAKELTGQSG